MRGIVSEVDDREACVGVRRGRRRGGVAEQESDGHDHVAAIGDVLVDVAGVVLGAAGLEEGDLDAELLLRPLHAGPRVLVEAVVVDAADVADHAGLVIDCGRRALGRGNGLGCALAGRLGRARALAAAVTGRQDQHQDGQNGHQ